MANVLFLILRHPLQSASLLYSFLAQIFVLILHRTLLPHFPSHQTLRTQIQRAYQAAAALSFPDFPHRLPVSASPGKAKPVSGDGFTGYIIPGHKPLVKGNSDGESCVILFAHGGGYARGEARMYINYMRRWEAEASKEGLDLVFLSVEYPLSTDSPHPAQRNAFTAAYRFLLQSGLEPNRIIFGGDSAGGGLSILSSIHLLKLNLPQPAGTVLISPWIDMSLRAYEGGNANVLGDYFVRANEAAPQLVDLFIDKIPRDSPEVNPLYSRPEEISGLAPQLILVGGAEFALQDSKEWAALCDKAGIEHKLVVEWGQLHVYAMGSKFLDPGVRKRTDAVIISWILKSVNGGRSVSE